MAQEIADIFKAYDIRGLVDTEITADFAFATGLAFARFLQQEREPATIVIGEDMRPSSPSLAEASPLIGICAAMPPIANAPRR